MIKSIKVLSGFAADLEALKNRTFNFVDGVNVLYGPNGSGKTTLLQIAASHCFINPKDGGSSKLPEPMYWPNVQVYNIENLKKVASRWVRNCEAEVEWDGTASLFLRANNEVKGYFEDNNEIIPIGDQFNKCLGSFSDGQWQAKILVNTINQAKKVADLTLNPSKYNEFSETSKSCSDIFTSYIKSLPRDGKPTLLLDEPDKGFSVDTQSMFWNKFVPHLAKDFQLIVSSNSPFSLAFDVISLGDENYIQNSHKDIVSLAKRFSNAITEEGGRWSVYIVRTNKEFLYTGVTTNIEHRVKQHNSGTGAKSLRGQGPVELVWSKSGMERGEAMKMEARIKSWTRKEKELLICGENDRRL